IPVAVKQDSAIPRVILVNKAECARTILWLTLRVSKVHLYRHAFGDYINHIGSRELQRCRWRDAPTPQRTLCMLPPAKFRGRYVRPKTILAATMAVGSLLAVASPASAAAFSFTTIDVPGAIPGSTRAGGINNSGQIVGSFVAGAKTHGFLDIGGSFTTIDVPAPPPPPGTVAFTVAYGINGAGQVVGNFGFGTN